MNNVINFTATEIKEYSVSELSNRLKHCVESEFGYVKIRGEISGLKIAASGHAYFNLKDDNAILASTCWRHAIAKMNSKLDEGLEVIATGKMTTYAGQSRYQLSVEHIEPAGAGALMQILASRKAKLQAEGLFDNDKKKPIPFFPQRIGVITSLSGAVIQDILHRISDRCPTRVLIWPVTVQGEMAASEISNAIDGFDKMLPELRPDVIIIARGGGSIEDLWAFNEEIVVRSIAASNIPIISAIGHETDFTLSDFAADMRAPTPTAAAEFATPMIEDIKHTITTHFARITSVLQNYIKHKQDLLFAYNKVLSSPSNLIFQAQQRLDDLVFNLYDAPIKLLNLRGTHLRQYRLEFLNPLKLLPMQYTNLKSISHKLQKSCEDLLIRLGHQTTLYSSLLSTLDYRSVISRGFSVIRSEEGLIISSIGSLPNNKNITIELKDGRVKSKIL